MANTPKTIVDVVEAVRDYTAENYTSRQLLKDTVGWTGKNLLENTATSGSYQGITYTFNSDKSINIDGTNTDSSQNSVTVGIVTLEAGTYIINGLKNDGGYTSFWINLFSLTDQSNIKDVKNANEDVTFTLSDPKQVRVRIYWAGNATISNIRVYPMIRLASDPDDTYEPYHSNVVNTLREAEVIQGKNLLNPINYEAVTKTTSGITYTVDGDGVVDANGTATADANLELIISPIKVDGAYILSGCPANGSTTTYGIQLYTTHSSQGAIYDVGNGFQFEETDYITRIVIRIRNGQTVNHMKFYPMIRLATETDPTYEPYYDAPLKESMFRRSEQRVLGAKNLLPNTATSKTTSGVTFTVNDDGSITANGTASVDTELNWFVPLDAFIVNETYILSGCPIGGALNKYTLDIFGDPYDDTKFPIKRDFGDGISFTIPSDTGATQFKVRVWVKSGQVFSNLTFYPMVRLASDPDNTYAPYAMTNRELTDYAFPASAQTVLGAKNLLKNTAVSQTINGITFTVNADKSITVSPGTATGNAVLELVRPIALKQGKYILSGCPTHNYDNNVYVQLRKSDNPQVDIRDTGNSQIINVTSDTTYTYVAVVIISGVVLTSALTFKPMIRFASDPDDTYVPYAMTNLELTEKVANSNWENATVNSTNVISGTVRYKIKSGVCFVEMMSIKFSQNGNGQAVASGLPLADGFVCAAGIAGNYTEAPNGNGFFISDNTGVINAHVNQATYSTFCSFCYPVRNM